MIRNRWPLHFSSTARENPFSRFARDERGNVAIIAAAVLMLVVGCAALSVDVGSVFADKRKTQSAADLAALVAAGDLSRANAAAAATVASNNYPPGSLIAVELGAYSPDATLSPAQRFVTPAANANAVRVTMQTQTPLYFGKVLTGASQFAVTSSAIASTTRFATFAIGSRLASVNGGLLNGILGAMLGTSLSLSAMDYQALIDARIDLFDFMSALATRADVSGLTYTSLLSSNLKITDIVGALVTAQTLANGNSSATAALSSVASSLAGTTARLIPSTLLDPGPYGSMTAGQKPKVSISAAAFDLMAAIASIANGSNQIATAVNLSLPGISAITLQATVGARPSGTSWVTVGSQGASVHTAQTRVLLNVKLIGSGSVSAVNLPVYVEIASGTATLNSVSCSTPNLGASSVGLGVSPGIVDAWIGNVTPADMANLSSKPNPPAVNIVNLGVIQVSGRAHATMANTAATTVNFSYADIQAQTKKTVTTTSYTSSLTSSLLNDLSLSVQLGPLGLPIPGIAPLVTGIIGGASGSIDTLLATVLQTLGVGVGQADVWVTGIRCDGAVLVN